MIPFQLHRRIPFVRRPFYQRDQAREEVSRLTARVALLEAERTAATAVTSPELPPNRTQDLKSTYERYVARLQAVHPQDEVMSLAVGGGFEQFGRIELALLRHYGLQPDDWLIDVGCGSGRLVKPLSEYSTEKYSGFDVVSDLVSYAQQLVARVDWRFGVVDHISIPEPDGCADMVCFFSVLTHLLHEQSYWYLEEAVRVLKPKGKIVFSFLDFSEPAHWPIFIESMRHSKQNIDVPMNVFIAKEAIYVWARHLGVEVEAIVGAQDAVVPEGALGQSICVLRKP
jgi:ubiquinone/menaquinone biosynthesis C-methylase UbiE